MSTAKRSGALAAVAALAGILAGSPGCQEIDTTITIRANGSCEIESKIAIARETLEEQVRMMAAVEDGGFMFDEEEPGEEEKEPPKPTDAELASKVKEMFEKQREMTGGPETKIEKVEVEKERVRVVAKQSFESVKDMLSQPGFAREVGVSSMVFEKDEEGRLRITLDAPRGARDARMMREQIKQGGAKVLYRFELPGKVVSSDFPHTEGKATWIVVDAEKDETLDALEKALKAGKVVIVAESGGLAIDGKLDSRKLARPMRFGGGAAEPDIPVTDAGPGFIAEASSITTTTVRYFPGAPKEYRESDYEGKQTGVVVQAKLFPPRGRMLLSVGRAVARSAVDDQGRKVAPPRAEGGEDEMDIEAMTMMSMRGGEEEGRSADMALRLGLPEPDAEAIEELAGEVVATTFGKWKEHPVENVKADPEKQIDLGDVLPGAKMIVKKVSDREQRAGGDEYKSRSGSIQVELSGPPEVGQVSFKVEIPGSDQSSGHDMGGRSRTKDKVTTRDVNVSYHCFGKAGPWMQAAPTLKVRYPDELRRERVKFRLEGLDLF